jgi:hypothetical protein
MTNGRRLSDRRRRVLYTAHQADSNPSTAASRRAAERLREARRPTAAYGVRVKRRLRGRWFSLVPVRRRSLTTVVSLLFAAALTLTLAHYAAVAWPAIAYRPEIARPLRLDRPDSFGRFFLCALLAGSAGVSLLIYQLRRYRIDDYQGRYRLWRLVLIVMALASVNGLVSILEWGGALVDAAVGRRVALSGSDWLRLVVSIGGVILALRLIAEVRRSRWSLATMIVAGALLAIPEATKWNFIKVESIGLWTLNTSAPLLAFTTLFVSLTIYLRMLYREVRQIEDSESLAERMQRFRLRVFQRSDDFEDDAVEDDHDEEVELPDEADEDRPRKRRWWQRRRTTGHDPAQQEDEEETEEDEEEETRRPHADKRSPQAADDADDSDADESEPPPRARRRWFGRRAKPEVDQTSDQEDAADDEPDDDDPPQSAPRKKRRRFSLRLDPAASSEPDSDDPSEEPADEPADEPKAKRGLGGWFGKRKAAAAQDAPDEEAENDADQPAAAAPAAQSDDDEMNPDDIDWDSLSKSERRRLRKKLKRQGRAA